MKMPPVAAGAERTLPTLCTLLQWFHLEIIEVKEVLSRFPGEHKRKSKTDADVICPVHDDHNPSLGVDLRQNGAGSKVVLNCRSQGCEYSEILEAVGLTDADLKLQEKNVMAYGCTLEAYASKLTRGVPDQR